MEGVEGLEVEARVRWRFVGVVLLEGGVRVCNSHFPEASARLVLLVVVR
jgi:hypothetical protein